MARLRYDANIESFRFEASLASAGMMPPSFMRCLVYSLICCAMRGCDTIEDSFQISP